MHYNAVDLIKIYVNLKKKILSHFKTNPEKEFVIDQDRFYISTKESLPDKIFQFIGKTDIKAKEVIECFYNVWNKPFYIPIDMSHLDGSPCLLNYIFQRDLNFE
jgi:hypothetical protein